MPDKEEQPGTQQETQPDEPSWVPVEPEDEPSLTEAFDEEGAGIAAKE